MSRRILIIIPLILINAILMQSYLFGVDLTPFYRASLFKGEAKRNTSDWTTQIDAQYTQGETRNSWNPDEVKSDLFDNYGLHDFTKLATNMENLDAKPKTKAYADGTIPNLYDGNVSFKGEFSLDEYNFTLQQNLLWGLYLQVYVPVRNAKICGIDYCITATTNADRQTLTNFIDNDLDGILDENCIKPLKTSFDKTQIADILVSLGWHGHCTFSKSMITALRGFLQMGAIIPSGDRKDIDQVFSLPMGYNKHWAINARGNIHATLWEKFVIGLNAGTSVFFRQTHEQRLSTAENQSGWLILEQGKATSDPGTLWDVTGYLKAERIIAGLSLLAGYSFTQQERTSIILRDDCILQTAVDNELICNKNEILSLGNHLREWYHHTFHCYAQYDFSTHEHLQYAPIVRISYDYSILGKRTWNTNMFGGSIGFVLDWCW